MRRLSPASLAIAAGLVLVVAAVALRWLPTQPRLRSQASGDVVTAAAARANAPDDVASVPVPADNLTDQPWPEDTFPSGDAAARAWASVDFAAIREALPDNTYWKMAVPTKDPDILRQREEARERWNTEYGKILSNTAGDEEIDAYYAERQRLSEDYLHFIVYLLTNYGYQIPARDVATLKLAAEMHNARLEEIPRQITEAHERHAAHDAARRAWQEQQHAFDSGDASATP
jgi:hypothetical protein